MKKFVLILLILPFLSCTFALDYDYTFSLEPVVVARYGTVYEYVFVTLSSGADYKLSQLEWDLKPMWLFGGKFKSTLGDFGLGGSVIGGVKRNTGIMKDWDYENFNGKATKYSEHTANLKNHLEASGTVSYAFDFSEMFKVEPFAAFNYSVTSWDAVNGFLQYPPVAGYWNSNLPKAAQTGKIISYSNKVWYPSAGVHLGLNVFSFIGLETSFSAAPYVWAESVDNHWLTNTEFKDTMQNGYGLFADVKMTFNFYNYHTISLFANASTIQNLKGTSYYRDTTASAAYTPLKNQLGGSASSTYSFGISYKITVQ